MTSADGYCYAVDTNGKLIAATRPSFAAGAQYGLATWTYTFWYDSACSTNQITGTALNNIEAGSITLAVTGAARTRLALSPPTAVETTETQFGAVFDSSLGNAVNAVVGSITDGVITWSSGENIYYTIYGGAAADNPLKDKTALDALIGTAAQDDGASGFEQVLTVS